MKQFSRKGKDRAFDVKTLSNVFVDIYIYIFRIQITREKSKIGISC